MKKISEILFLTGAVLLLLIPMLTTNLRPNQTSEFDNRNLQEFPTPGAAGFRTGLEEYVSDRIGFRTEMITAYQKFCDAAFHKLVHPSYIYGKGEYIMTPWDLDTYQHLDVDENLVETYTDYLERLQRFCGKQGAEFLFYLCPNKETIYPEYFSDGYNVKNQPNRSDRILEELEKKGVASLSPKEMFLSLKEDVQLYNVKYDAGHWNETGAFYGHQQIIHYLNEKFPGMGELTQDEFEITEVHKDSLPASHFEIDEMVPYYDPIDTAAVEHPEVFEQVGLAAPNQYHYYYQNDAARQRGAPKVLIFGDSYLGIGANRFYMNHCSELMLVHRNNLPSAEYYITLFQPDVVIYEVVERSIVSAQRYFSATKQYFSLSDVLYDAQENLYAQQIALHIDRQALQSDANKQKFVTISGTLPEMSEEELSGISDLAAVLNGRLYYAMLDQTTSKYQFTFRAEVITPDAELEFYVLRDAEP